MSEDIPQLSEEKRQQYVADGIAGGGRFGLRDEKKKSDNPPAEDRGKEPKESLVPTIKIEKPPTPTIIIPPSTPQ